MKRIFRKALSLILAAVIIFGAAPLGAVNLSSYISASAKELETNGQLTDTISWIYNKNNLRINGTGDMPDFDSAEDSPFAGMAFDGVLVNEGITSIGTHTFENSKIGRLFIHNSLNSINDYAFHGCNSDMEITYYCDSGNEEINVGKNNDFLEENIHCFITYSVSDGIFAYLDLYNGKLFINGNGEIPDYASPEESPFINDVDYIYNIDISWNISEIGSYAFADINADYILFANSIENIHANAFSGAKIDTICFYDDIENPVVRTISPVGNECFDNAPHTQHYEYNYQTEEAFIKGTGAMPDCSINGLSPLDLGGGALTKIVVEDGITRIGAYAFDNCAPEIIEISDTVKSIGEYALAYRSASVKSVVVGNSVETIEEGAFYALNNLTSVDLPDSLKYIGDSAFAGAGIDSLYIPANVSHIGENAFGELKNLKSIDVDPENKYYCTDENGILYSKDKKDLLQCPSGCEAKTVTVPAATERIFREAFDHNSNLEEVIIKSPAVLLGTSVFLSSPNIKTVFIDANNVYYSEYCGASFVSFNEDAFVVCPNGTFAAQLKDAGVNCVTYIDKVEKGHLIISLSGTVSVDKDSDYQFIKYLIDKYSDAEYVYFDNLVLEGVDAAETDSSISKNVTAENGNVYLKNVYIPTDIDGKALSFGDIINAAENGTLTDLISIELTEAENPSFFDNVISAILTVIRTIENFASGALKTISKAINRVIQIFRR